MVGGGDGHCAGVTINSSVSPIYDGICFGLSSIFAATSEIKIQSNLYEYPNVRQIDYICFHGHTSKNKNSNAIMRSTLIITFLFLTYFTKASATFNLSIYSCKTDSMKKSYAIEVHKNGIFYKTILLNRNNKFETTLKVEKDTYSFQYKNIFGQLVSDTLSISKDTGYWKMFCTDEFLNMTESFNGHLDSLHENDFFNIRFESVGCFHWNIRNLKIFKNDKQFFATLSPDKEKRENKIKSKGHNTILLDKNQLQAIIDFQRDIYKNSVGFPGGSEITYCSFEYKKSKITFIDSDESIGRFKVLIKKIFADN
jgi:hypothetical protein